jgi:hypothetical protein
VVLQGVLRKKARSSVSDIASNSRRVY